MLITVTGRKTGRRYTIPVAYHQMADAIVIPVGETPRKMWWRNYRTPGPIELRLRGQCLTGTAEVVPLETAEFRQRFEAAFRRAGFVARILGIDWNPDTGLTDTQVKHLGAGAALVRVSTCRPRMPGCASDPRWPISSVEAQPWKPLHSGAPGTAAAG